MKYNKDNINGIEFQYMGEGTVWVIHTQDSVVIGNNGGRSGFTVNNMVDYLNKELWIPITQKEVIYEIY